MQQEISNPAARN